MAKILLVEDNEMNRDMLSRRLERKGFAVTLLAGIVASLFTGVFVVRTFYLIWLSRNKAAETLSI